MLTVNPRSIQRAIILFVFVAMCAILSTLSEFFLTATNISNVLQQISTLIITSCGATFVMIAGGIDLSVGGVVALAGVLSAGLAAKGLPLPVCFLAGVVAGSSVGALNGLLVSAAKIVPIIATLGTMWVSRGIAYIYTTSQTRGALSIVTGIPAGFRILGRGQLLSAPVNVVIAGLVFVVSFLALRFSVFGLRTYEVGCNEEATRRFGVNTDKHKLLIFILAGTLSGLSGVLLASRLSSGEPSAGLGFEFDVIVAVIIGGTSLHGGEGSLIGTLIGAFFVGVIANALNLLQVQTFYRYVVLGTVLITAVLIDTSFRRQDIRQLRIHLLLFQRRAGPVVHSPQESEEVDDD